MNLCEDVQQLSTPALANVDESWHDLCTHLASIIHNNVSSDFLVPTAYAFTELVLANRASVSISGPTAGAANEPSITVTLRYA